MNKSEIKQAIKILADRTDRTETAILETGGQCLTAYWTDGGQKLFYGLQQVIDHIESH